jgi:hypothetical protein
VGVLVKEHQGVDLEKALLKSSFGLRPLKWGSEVGHLLGSSRGVFWKTFAAEGPLKR